LSLLGSPTIIWHSRDAFYPPAPKTASDTALVKAHFARNFGALGVRVQAGLKVLAPIGAIDERTRQFLVLQGDGGRSTGLWIDESGERLRAADYQAGAWTATHTILAGRRIAWAPGTRSTFFRGEELHAVVTLFDSSNRPAIAYLRRLRTGQWLRTVRQFKGFPSFVAAAPLSTDSVLIVFNATDVDTTVSNGSHLWTVRMSVRDTMMPNARRIQWSGGDAAWWPVLHRMDDRADRFVVLWGRVVRGTGTSKVLYAMRSLPAASRWEAPDSIVLPVAIDGFSTLFDQHGVHLLAHPQDAQRDSQPAPLYSTTWNGRWSVLRPYAIGAIATSPILLSGHDGRKFLLWGATAEGSSIAAGQPRPPLTRYAMVTDTCLSGATTKR
jgi:hypothetical protein